MHDSLIYVEPETGKLERRQTIKRDANLFHSFLERDERARIEYYSSLYNQEFKKLGLCDRDGTPENS